MSRIEKEKSKAQQEKFQAILSGLLKDEDNKYCVDCDAKGPRWASWNLGIFLCIRCAGIHRNLGVHISRVKSVNLDSWIPEQVVMMTEIGNSRARAAYEAELPDNYRRPQTDSALEAFIRAKYEHKKYLAKEWVPPKPTIPKEFYPEWIEDDKEKKKTKSKPSSGIQLNAAPRPTKTEKKSSSDNQPKPLVKTPPAQPAGAAADLMGLEVSSSNSSNGDLLDIFGSQSTNHNPAPQPVSQAPVNVTANGDNLLQTQQNGSTPEESLFDDGPSKVAEKSTKESILALYGNQQQQQQMFGVPGYAYTCKTAMGGMYIPQQMPQQNVGMYGGGANMMAQPQGMPAIGQQQQMPYGNMGIQQQSTMYGMGQMGGMPQQQQTAGMMSGNQGNMMQTNMYAQQQQLQQLQMQQMQQQMNAMKVGGQMPGMTPQSVPGGWCGTPASGQTLSNNLWQ